MQIVTICMKCQNLFSSEYTENIIRFSSADLARKVVTVKYIQIGSAHAQSGQAT